MVYITKPDSQSYNGLSVGWSAFVTQHNPSCQKELVLPSRAMIEQCELVIRQATLAEAEALLELAAPPESRQAKR